MCKLYVEDDDVCGVVSVSGGGGGGVSVCTFAWLCVLQFGTRTAC